MQKFTAFTAILTVIVVIVVAEILVSEYFPSLKSMEGNQTVGEQIKLPDGINIGDAVTVDSFNDVLDSQASRFNNVLGEDSEGNVSINTSNLLGGNIFNSELDNSSENTKSESSSDFEDDNFTSTFKSVKLRDDQLKSAGFLNAYFQVDEVDGYLFKNISIANITDLAYDKFLARNDNSILLKVYVFDIGVNGSATDKYLELKNLVDINSSVEMNETNKFGDNSFYMNDRTRENVAFLTVRISNNLFAFSYPKEYHNQVVNFIQILSYELG